ncbi:hypothetical protein BsWGS_21677 [Bradybaena similaris]
MLAASVVWFLLLAALADARPQFGKPEDGRSFTDNNVQKLARPSPPETPAQNSLGQMGANAEQVMPPQPGMGDPRAQMAMMMQAAQFEQMRRQAAQGQASQNPAKGPTNGESADNNRLPAMPARLPPGAPPMPQPLGNTQAPAFAMPPMLPPVSGRNITEGHVPRGPSPMEMMMIQQQQMRMMNEYARRQQQQQQQQQGNRAPSQQEMQQMMMAQAAGREQFERMAMLQQQQSFMEQQAALSAVNRQSQINDNSAAPQTAGGFQNPMSMSPMGGYPQANDPQAQMQMEASQNMDPRMAMQAMLAQRMQGMSQDASSIQTPSLSESPENQVPDRETISSFVQRARGRNEMQRAMLQDPAEQGPAMLDPRMQQLRRMQDPSMSDPSSEDESRINSMRTMEMMAAMQDARMRQLSMMQSPPMSGVMVPQPLMQDPRIQSTPMPAAMMHGPMMPDSTMQQPSLMQTRMPPTPAAPGASPADDKQSPTMSPLSGQDISVGLPSMQHIMELEARLLEARQEILRSFYTDLLK